MLSHSDSCGDTKRRPKLPCQSALAHGTAPVGGQPRKGSEGPLWRVVRLPAWRLGRKQVAK
eukprot:14101254-Alexandrium_andersonii.AAC.1